MLDKDCIVQYVLSTKRDHVIDEHPYDGFLPRLNDCVVFHHRGNFRSFQVMNVTLEPRLRAVVILSPSPLNHPVILPILDKTSFGEVQYTSTMPPPPSSSQPPRALDIKDIRREVENMQPGQNLVFNVTRIHNQDLSLLLGLLDAQGYDTRVVSGHLTVTRLLD